MLLDQFGRFAVKKNRSTGNNFPSIGSIISTYRYNIHGSDIIKVVYCFYQIGRAVKKVKNPQNSFILRLFMISLRQFQYSFDLRVGLDQFDFLLS